MVITNKRPVYFCYDYNLDSNRAAQIRKIDVVEENSPLSEELWNIMKKSGKSGVQNLIDDELKNTSCTIVLIGSKTSESQRVHYTIQKSWDTGKGLLGIYIHNLKDPSDGVCKKGENPFSNFQLFGGEFENIIKCYDPVPNVRDPHFRNQTSFDIIRSNLRYWVEEAIRIRGQY